MSSSLLPSSEPSSELLSPLSDGVGSSELTPDKGERSGEKWREVIHTVELKDACDTPLINQVQELRERDLEENCPWTCAIVGSPLDQDA